MADTKTFTLDEAHKPFAVQFNNRTWELLTKDERTSAEDEEMIHAAHASHYHWLFAGKELNEQRGEWLISHVYAVLNVPDRALFHAKKCLHLTEELDLDDFDLAYAYEGMARALACNHYLEEAEKYHVMARHAGEKIRKEEDRNIFITDLEGEPWYKLQVKQAKTRV